jgi:EPS-associated MarR family transcriptional regulator
MNTSKSPPLQSLQKAVIVAAEQGPNSFKAESKRLPRTTLQEENNLKVLRLLEANPQLSPRELADALGVSLGKTNYCLKALLSKGLIKMQSFKKSQNKLAYAYLLTPDGITEKAGLTVRFLARKMAEFESLTLEIEALKSEMNKTEIKPASIHN